jgi:hypothetical protein
MPRASSSGNSNAPGSSSPLRISPSSRRPVSSGIAAASRSGNHGVQPDIGRLLEITQHRPELETQGHGFDRVHFRENRLDALHYSWLQIQVERQVLDGRHVPTLVHLQVPDHRVGDLSDHDVLERSGYRHEDQHRHHPEHDQPRGQQRPTPVPQQVAGRQAQDAHHMVASAADTMRPSSR